jgi:glycosyltransferase involved in cell wall biosynthesis
VRKIIHVVRNTQVADEGGTVRDKAFYEYFREKPEIETLALGHARIWNLLRVLLCLRYKKRMILLHISSMGFPILNNGPIGSIAARLLLWWFQILSTRNKVVLEVNDLFVDQARDLHLPVPINFQKIEQRIFSRKGVTYAFASESMRKYAIEKFGIAHNETLTVINGDNPAPDSNAALLPVRIGSNHGLKFVYSGTLNKGRQIEKMLQSFEGGHNQLILLGKDGEWISQEYFKNSNIVYLGAFDSSRANAIVASCDVGLIPYPEDRGYFQIAYPTKVSSYLVAGIPFLSTRVREVERILEGYQGIGKCLPIDEWAIWINQIKHNELAEMKQKIAPIRSDFTWEHILGRFEETLVEIAQRSGPCKG